MNKLHSTALLCVTVAVAMLGACRPESAHDPLRVPTTYTFAGRFGPDSSVAYTGQVFRHVLMGETDRHLKALTARLDDGRLVPTAGAVTRELTFFYDFDGATS